MLKLFPFWDPLRGDSRFEANRRLVSAEKTVRLNRSVLQKGATLDIR